MYVWIYKYLKILYIYKVPWMTLDPCSASSWNIDKLKHKNMYSLPKNIQKWAML